MSTIFIVLAFYSVLHFIYESILAPSFRLHLRNELFTLRDKLRSVHISGGHEEDDVVFEFIDDGICSFIDRLSSINIGMQIQTKQMMESYPNLRNQIRNRIEMIEKCQCREYREIFQETNHVLMKALLTNSGAWIPLVLPTIIFGVCYRQIIVTVKRILLMPASQLNGLINSSYESSYC